MKKIMIIGGGAGGIMAAITSKNMDNQVIIIEKNKVIGQKLSITGNSRCNITNIDSRDDFFKNIIENPKFFYSSFAQFSNFDFISYLEDMGIELKFEEARAYPKNESAQKLVNVFIKKLEEKNIDIHLEEEMTDLKIKDDKVQSIKTNKSNYVLDEDFTDVIIATGGLSYNKNNTFNILKNNIEITKLYPSLVSINTVKDYSELSGVSIQDTIISTQIDGKNYQTRGHIIFTLKGLSGSAIMDMTANIVKYQDNYIDIAQYQRPSQDDVVKYKDKKIVISIDFLPNISREELEQMLFDNSKKLLKTKISDYIPSKLAKFLLEKYNKVDTNNMKKEQRLEVINLIKNYKIQAKSYGDIKSAIVTKGGISVNTINPKTMQSKDIDNLYFVGECIDIDALEGGYNLQIAFSTGYVAGMNFV